MQVVDHDRPRGSQFDYCEDTTEKYIDKMSDMRGYNEGLIHELVSDSTWYPCVSMD
jgi:hypothetical protein